MINNAPPARLLDVTRLLRRAGRIWTGVDRVELAYLDALIADPVPVWGLARTPFGYVLLDQSGLVAFQRGLTGTEPFAAPDLVSRMQRRLSPGARRAQAEVRRRAVARCLPRGLARMLARHLPRRVSYLNIGHSNLTARVLQAVRNVPDAHIAVFVHDVIPLTHPECQRAGTVALFEAKMRRVRTHADLIVYNSADTRAQTERVMGDWGPVPQGIVAHLGTSLSVPDQQALPEALPPTEPYFITVGTIEPRKNHELLLDLWEDLGADAPVLLICGSRGWNNDAVFARLDAMAAGGRVREVSGLTDPALAALIEGAQAMLFPSLAEGFGLPAVESLMLGTPVICSNLETFREVLTDNAVYIDDSGYDLWKSVLVNWAEQPRVTRQVIGFVGPSWDEHFKAVLRLI